ncbi:phosphotransacetylase family protein [Halorientalis pallida]|uniref:Phosphotransacetylase family protein n=1 Tax=Halorientalis pallida TaxID=2479928 RepID=A0A498KVW7_9EURY|nr:phosphotransacetylase family protein [Halorientalis pallida]RXK49026.1 phosphotransacetylase family protein [Halorientalis pallida]
MNPILVSSTEASTGKTAVALALARHAADGGKSVGYMKPKGTRLQSAVGKTLDQDPMLAREILDLDEQMHEMEPIVYSPTFVQEAVRGREDLDALHESVTDNYERIADGKDAVVIEGAGEYTTGGIIDLTDPDLADLLDARVLLIANYDEPADLDDVLAAADAFGDRLGGVLFNGVSDDEFDELTEDVIPFLRERGVTVYGAIPQVQELSGVTVGELAAELGADLLTSDAPTDAYVERFLVGAMGRDAALSGFRRAREAAVITGGDRSDIQTAALGAPGVKCLLLTGGHRPSGAVVGRAEEAGKPILLVQGDTRTTIDRAESVVRSGRTRDPGTVERMGDLLADAVDLDALLALGE